MTTPTAWAHLPNAAHIDRVLAHLAQHPEQWDAAWTAAWTAARGAARGAAWDATWAAARGAPWTAAWDAARGAAWTAARDAAGNTAWSAARNAAWDAVSALAAWDDCAAYLTLPVDVVRHLSDDGLHAATLLLPAVVVFAGEKEAAL